MTNRILKKKVIFIIWEIYQRGFGDFGMKTKVPNSPLAAQP